MPELPEVEALVRYLDHQSRHKRLARLELASFAALKTVSPGLPSLMERTIAGWRRKGKYLLLETDGPWLVVHLARGGWIRWYDELPAATARPGRAPLALRVGLEPDDRERPVPGFDISEFGTEKHLALWVVDDPGRVEGVASLGVDPLDPNFDCRTLAHLLGESRGSIKSALTTQSLLAGIGNAYSDEVLHSACLSPFKPAARLTVS